MEAQVSQARAVASKAMSEREMYVRLVALLANAVLGEEKIAVVDGRVLIPKSSFDMVPRLWTVSVTSAQVEPEIVEGEEAGPKEDVVVVTVEPKKEAPTLVVAQTA